MKKNMIKILILGITLIIIWRAFAEPFRMLGDCMEPAIQDGKLYFVNRVFPYLRKIKTGNIIIYKHEGKIWVSRVVALEGDSIGISENAIHVNGTPLNESGVKRDWANWKYGSYAIDNILQIPIGSVFVLSDKLSAHHDDSRVFGPISKESILGVVW